MCIIIAKARKQQGPTWDSIMHATQRNPDGFALAYSLGKGKAPRIIRSMKRTEVLDVLKGIVNRKSASWILHARIATHGSKRAENCHCWQDADTGLVFAHNGILGVQPEGDMTDSETAFRRLLVPAMHAGGGEAFEAAISAIIGNSKFAVMDHTGEIFLYGRYLEEEEASYSNDTYKPYQSLFYGMGRSYGYGGYGSVGDLRATIAPKCAKAKPRKAVRSVDDADTWDEFAAAEEERLALETGNFPCRTGLCDKESCPCADTCGGF